MAFRTLIGRSRELADLEAALARALAGQGGTFLLSGEPGIGKTRLAEEIAERARSRAASVFWGRAWEVEGAPACWPWVQVLRACAQTEAGAGFVRDDAHGRELEPLLAREPAARAAGDPEQDLLRVGFAVVALLERLSRHGPLVLVFDDLHASDVASLNLLEMVARELRGLRVLLVGTYREVEARRVPKVASLLARLAREGSVRPLGRLDRGAVTEWVTMALGAEPAEALAAALFDATEGNPLFVDALSQLLASRGHGATLPAGFALPDGIRETVQELLARLSASAREVLDAAAVLGRECTSPILQLVSGKAAEEVLAAVAEGIEAGVLSEQPSLSSPVRFAHVLVREAIYRALPALRRIALHAGAARALERLPDREEHLAELAHHTFESGPAGSWLTAADYASRAGHRAMALFAHDDAAKHFERALAALDQAGSAEDARRADWLWRLGLSQIRLGQSRLGRDTCERAANLAMQCGEHETHARAALAYGSEFTYGYVDPRLVALLESVLASPLADRVLRVRAMARLAAAMMPTEFPERPMQLRAEAIAAARALDDRRVLADVLFAVRAAFTPEDDLDERIALDRELAVLAVMLDDRLLELTAHTRLTFDAVESADPSAVQVELRIQEQLANEMRTPFHQLRVACSRLLWASLTADAEEIARVESRVRDLADAVDQVPALAILEANRYARAAIRGDDAVAATALTAWEERIAHLRTLKIKPLWRANRLAYEGHHDEARAVLHDFAPDGPRAGVGPPILAFVAPACIRIGYREWIERSYELLVPYAARNTMSFIALVSFGPFAYHLGALAAALGRREKAIEHFRDALVISERVGFVDYAARIRRELGALEGPRPPLPVSIVHAAPPDLRQEGEYWTLRHEGREVRLRDSKGVHYLSVLLGEPGREFHVADLVGLAGDLGAAGELLDARAKAAYQERLARLADAFEDAEARGDHEAAARIRGEREALGDELSRAMGLGGRIRKSGSVAERARINVQRRIRDVITRVSEADAAMGRYLERHVKTGSFCAWEP